MKFVSWRAAKVYRPLRQNLCLYDGPSSLTGEHILVIATAQNGNRKIGEMLQLWIIPAISPIEAVRTGADAAVCGDCKLRGDGFGRERSCYVEWWRAVANIWQSWANGRTRNMLALEFARQHKGLQLRIGAYGDPAAVPLEFWETLLSSAAGWTAYTHQWERMTEDARRAFQVWCMASVDCEAEQAAASAAGWRTYRMRLANEEKLKSEVSCPASEEGGKKTVCGRCKLCRGQSLKAKHVTIIAHNRSSVYIPVNRLRHEQRRIV